ncbi:stage II sporulation protein R [Desulforamulus putei DSM 12395]|uniref:Stage II sporulation protein R n=1 Tax=Desulforamulus putei DSM 12395 TaxID=1121429 RepID=A0A1M4XH78_9FIRM|nr:stage II sporulation protein R [Desulforamulus putei DSM 12395]
MVGLAFLSYRTYIQHEFASQLIRFHVIANSNSLEDQTLKLHVRDVIVKEMKERFRQASSRQEAEQIVQSSMNEIKELAQAQIKREGKDYQVAVMMGDFAFPTKTYGNLTLPAGNYHAVRIVIGEGKGKNWWCILFPPLCFVDSVETLDKDEKAKGIKVFERDNVEFRLKCADFLKIFS